MKPYMMIFDTEHSTDGIEFNTFEAAKADMIDTYLMWKNDEISRWEDINNPTEKEKEDFNYMIETCCCYIVKWVSTEGRYQDIDDGYVMPDEELEELGWKELS